MGSPVFLRVDGYWPAKKKAHLFHTCGVLSGKTLVFRAISVEYSQFDFSILESFSSTFSCSTLSAKNYVVFMCSCLLTIN